MTKAMGLIYFGLVLVGIMIFLALCAPWLTSWSPTEMNLEHRFLFPDWGKNHFLGTDQNGVDIWSQIVFGARVSMTVALAVVATSLIVGLVVGSLAGFLGGLWDLIIMRVIDMVYAFPGFLLILTIAAVIQSSELWQIILVLSLTGWASYARLVRGEILHLKEKDYVLGAQAIGASSLRQLIMYIWPNLVSPLTIQASFGMAVVIITESSLSFLGIGIPPTTPTWGSLLSTGRHFLLEAPYISIFPGLALLVVVLGFNLLGDGLRDVLDPRQKNIK